MKKIISKKSLSSFQIIILGFALVIFVGSVLLMLPISSRGHTETTFLDALFTSTSAVCVTGLVVHDTATYWSDFGQFILILLIQIGGMGVVSVAAFFAIISGRKIGLFQRSTMQEAISAPKVGGIVRLTGFILKAILLFECLGAVILAPVFIKRFGIWKGIWYGVFHSISAFCNAGFDLMGVEEPFSSLTAFSSHSIINLAIMGLIVIGGIGFLTWEDIRTNTYHIRRYRMQSKVILVTTGLLIMLPAIYFFCYEYVDGSVVERIWLSVFQSVTARTAGFNTGDLSAMSEAGQTIMIFLMLIGGSPGSTAGGMKTTTLAVLVTVIFSVFARKESASIFGRRILDSTVKSAITIFLMYITLFWAGAFVISLMEKIPMLTCLYETASAIGTVGLTLGITSTLGAGSKIILILLMYFGRVGGLTLIYAAISEARKTQSKLPQERITVG